MRLLLASGSPRRRELLLSAGLSFEVEVPDVDETVAPGESPADAVCRLARDKALRVAARHPDAAVLAADTTVVLDGVQLEKPRDAADARRMLRALSGRSHEVLTGFAIARGDEVHVACCVTEVSFRPLREEEIEAYIATGDPMDKAGAYGIQSGAAHMVRAIRGSYTNVVGLPLAEVMEVLWSLGEAGYPS